MLENVRLNGSVIKEVMVSSRLECGSHCGIADDCVSYNLCAGRICQLNSKLWTDSTSNDTQLYDPQCVYSGMKPDFERFCYSGQDSSNPHYIFQYQYLSVSPANPANCAKYELVISPLQVTDDSTEYKVFRSQQCLLAGSVVDLSNCLDDPSAVNEEVLEWYIFYPNGAPWTIAKQTCESLGGLLFGDLNGTTAQLQFFQDKLGNPIKYHLGVTNEDNVNIWKSTRGEDMTDKIIWYTNPAPTFTSTYRLILRDLTARAGTGTEDNAFACTMT